MPVKRIQFKPDPAGFFYIYVDGRAGKIVVEHYLNVERKLGGRKVIVSGRVNKKFTGRKADRLYREILAHKLASRLDHAAYLGMELAKAETALENNLDYEQDRKLKIK